MYYWIGKLGVRGENTENVRAKQRQKKSLNIAGTSLKGIFIQIQKFNKKPLLGTTVQQSAEPAPI